MTTNIPKIIKLICLIPLFIVITSCDKLFEYSPFSANVPEKRENTTLINTDKIHEIEKESNGLTKYKIAIISDNHLNFDDLDDAIESINLDNEVLFTIHCGDVTDNGMLSEYFIFQNIANKLNRPYLTVIGNHDCLANGELIYEEMFGPENYSLEFKGSKFIFFNDIVWELNNREPEFFWLNDELFDAKSYDHVFVITHIPPWSDQYTPLKTMFYKSLMKYQNVAVSIHGHHHDQYYGQYFNDSINYVVTGSVDKRGYYKMTVEPDTFYLEKISF